MAEKPESLKMFTNYICPTGGGLGHSSIYTGGYEPTPVERGVCICGTPLVEDLPDGFRYRLEFETVMPLYAAEFEHRRGYWQQLSQAEWANLPWVPVSKEVMTKAAIANQFNNLLAHAESHEQPIRNVRMLRTAQGEWEEVNHVNQTNK